jgi:hypothetical protein
MKVKCIFEYEESLTIGKIYNVINENNGVDTKDYYIKNCFKPLSEIRNKNINKLLYNEN